METLARIIEIHIRKALRKYGSQEKAASALGISSRTIRNYLTAWGDERPHRKKRSILSSKERDRYESKSRW